MSRLVLLRCTALTCHVQSVPLNDDKPSRCRHCDVNVSAGMAASVTASASAAAMMVVRVIGNPYGLPCASPRRQA